MVGEAAEDGCADVVTRQVVSVAFSHAARVVGAVASETTGTPTSAVASLEPVVSVATGADASLSGTVGMSASAVMTGIVEEGAMTSAVGMTCQREWL